LIDDEAGVREEDGSRAGASERHEPVDRLLSNDRDERQLDADGKHGDDERKCS
jgi:hypothetical protein